MTHLQSLRRSMGLPLNMTSRFTVREGNLLTSDVLGFFFSVLISFGSHFFRFSFLSFRNTYISNYSPSSWKCLFLDQPLVTYHTG